MSNNSIIQTLAENTKKPLLMTHVVLGYPTLELSIEIVETMSKAGAGLIELQIPFSDPMADGPSIMQANEVALKNGVSPLECMNALKALSTRIQTPLLLMSYYNILLRYRGAGLKQFCADAAEAGASGLIVPDIPREEAEDGYWSSPQEHGLLPISLVAPVTEEARLASICAQAQGFLYCVATTGTTGARQNLPPDLGAYLDRVRKHTTIPLAVGFGISSPEQVALLGEHAQIAIVGSAMINCIKQSAEGQVLDAVHDFTAALAAAGNVA